MSKQINITHIDDQKTDEKIGEQKKPMVHEQLFKEYNIDPKRVNNELSSKPIPREWIPEIIELNIESIDVDVQSVQHKVKSRVFILIFDNNDLVKEFNILFSKSIFNSINSYISSKGKNVKTYHRNIVFTIKDDELKLTIEY